MATLHIFGIRHHGPGSARRLVQALTALAPDLLLVEGPPEGDALLSLLDDPDLVPPVALLVYPAKATEAAAFYPFADFSPEWQALHYARRQGIPARFIDLSPAWAWPRQAASSSELDPLGEIARQAGYADGETWWEEVIERPAGDTPVFEALRQLIGAVRAQPHFAAHEDPHTLRREAWMRQQIRAAQAEGFARIAVVCGAFHAPALDPSLPLKADQAQLRGLKRTPSRATWVPWTYRRLARRSGYGAGIDAPQWYEWCFSHAREALATRWLTEAARLLRAEDLDAAPAQVLDAVRLTHALAHLRGQAAPRLDELSDAVETVFCQGDLAPLHLIEEQLIVGRRMGRVPATVPDLPLQQDVKAQQRSLRLAPHAAVEEVELDLRKDFHRRKSHFLHRLALLGIGWGEPVRGRNTLGTFRETWRLRWEPECDLRVIEAAIWGQTVAEAAVACAQVGLSEAHRLPELTSWLARILPAALPELVPPLAQQLRAAAALDAEVDHLMQALSPLVQAWRYGDVRATHGEWLLTVLDSLVPRVWVGLPPAARHISSARAASLFPLVLETHHHLRLLISEGAAPGWQAAWHNCLNQLARDPDTHPRLGGLAARLLVDAKAWDTPQAADLMQQILSPGTPAEEAATWIEGFLHGSGLLLLHHPALWSLVDDWISHLPEATFRQALPLLRRTFAHFAPAERQQMGTLAQGGETAAPRAEAGPQAKPPDEALAIWRYLLGEA